MAKEEALKEVDAGLGMIQVGVDLICDHYKKIPEHRDEIEKLIKEIDTSITQFHEKIKKDIDENNTNRG